MYWQIWVITVWFVWLWCSAKRFYDDKAALRVLIIMTMTYVLVDCTHRLKKPLPISFKRAVDLMFSVSFSWLGFEVVFCTLNLTSTSLQIYKNVFTNIFIWNQQCYFINCWTVQHYFYLPLKHFLNWSIY